MIQRNPQSTPLLFEQASVFPPDLGPYIKEVGRGKRMAKDLTREQARDAFRIILSGKATPAQIGALFQAYRIKSETSDELAGIIEAARATCQTATGAPVPHRVEIGLPCDGRLRAFHVLPLAAFIAARAGVQVFIHGDVAVGPKFGVNAVEILHAIGLTPSASILTALDQLNQRGVACMLQRDYSPAMAAIRPLRDEVILRGPLATAEKMLNLSSASSLLAGATHTPYGPIMAGAFERVTEPWGLQLAWVIQGAEGHIDIDPRRKTNIFDAAGTQGALEFNPSLWGDIERENWVPPDPPEISNPRDRDERRRWIEANVAWGRDVLAGRQTRGLPTLLATAALLLLAARVESNLDAAVERSRSLLGESCLPD
jgi:anthranilate phosphoribosyltransferase